MHKQSNIIKQLPPLPEGQSVTMYNHITQKWKTATITKCWRPPGLINYQQMMVVLNVETGVIFVLLRQQRLIVLHYHITPIVLYPIQVYPLHSQVIIPLILMLHNHQMDQLVMEIYYSLWTYIEVNLQISVETLAMNIMINNIITDIYIYIYMYTLIRNINIFRKF